MQQVMEKGVILRKLNLFIISLALLVGCSRPDTGRLMHSGKPVQMEPTLSESDSSFYHDVDSSQVEDYSDGSVYYRETLNKAESYYTNGVIYYQQNQLDSSQMAYEEALELLSDLEIDGGEYPFEANWMETLLKEIESDYRLTLMASGVLYSEGSAAAFRELFSDIKNFKNLKESGGFQIFTKDTVTYDVPIYLNEKVENSLVYLQTVAHAAFAKYLERSGRYITAMEKILEEEGLPHDLVYLPLIESGFNPHAYSYARAVGFWQFIYGTAKRYGLERNWWYDERRDFEKSTRAACRYLKALYNEFKSWELALAAYNGGEGRVRKEIKRCKTNDFWKLRLKKQTRDYVPLFMAATIIAKQPEKYGFYPNYDEPLQWETVEVSKCVSLSNISLKTDISVASLELLNPELIRGLTPPNYKNYKLRVPVGKKNGLLVAYDNIPSEKNTNWVRHKVRRGETVSTLARKYGVSMSSVVSANSLGRRYKIYAGQTLLIPTTGGHIGSGRTDKIVPDGSGTYVVKRGDTLWEIARVHSVSVKDLKSANNLYSNRIYPGRKLVIPGKGSSYVSSDKIYVVKKGDSLYKIAKGFGVSVSALKEANGLRSDTIYPLMRLNIPGYTSSNTSEKTKKQITYRVKKGDTLWRIARIFEVTIQDLMSWNNISNPSKLKIGDLIEIYGR